jgi:hypothetical protein
MRWKLLALLAGLGMTACAPIPTGSLDGFCAANARAVAALEAGLLAHPETPDAVGEPGTDVVIGYGAGCP